MKTAILRIEDMLFGMRRRTDISMKFREYGESHWRIKQINNCEN